MKPISIRQTYSGRHVLLTGASGFLGKVFLTMLLDHVPDVGRVYVLLRRKGTRTARERFEEMVNRSFAFRALHERLGEDLSTYLSERVEVLEGDISLRSLGLDTATAARLHRDLDLLVNCAGLVDFNPNVQDGLATNVDGTLEVATFVKKCEEASFLHVSTCYVSGIREGRVPEKIFVHESPNGKSFDAEEEYRSLKAAIERIVAKHDDPRFLEKLEAHILEHHAKNNGQSPTEKRIKDILKRYRRRYLRDAMIREGTERAENWGWTNTYTYTKGLSEALIALRYRGMKYSVLRPSIVESSISYPFPGWNEGFNTSGPLAYLLGSWFRHLPARWGNPFDVIPVDLVTRAMVLVGGALLEGTHQTVYHAGTTDRNLFTIERACELTALGHRMHYRRNGNSPLRRMVLSRWDAVTAGPDHPFNIKNVRAATRTFSKGFEKMPKASKQLLKIDRLAEFAARSDKKLAQVEEMLDLFMPFIHDHHYIFETDGLRTLSAEEEEFRFEPETINWREYWLYTHMPGLRRWCFPLMEGRKVESYQPDIPVKLRSRASKRRLPASKDQREISTPTGASG